MLCLLPYPFVVLTYAVPIFPIDRTHTAQCPTLRRPRPTCTGSRSSRRPTACLHRSTSSSNTSSSSRRSTSSTSSRRARPWGTARRGLGVACRLRRAGRHHRAATTRRARRSRRRFTTRPRPWRRARLGCPWGCRAWARRGPPAPRRRLASTARPRPPRRGGLLHQGTGRQGATARPRPAASPGHRRSSRCRRRPTARRGLEGPCARRPRPCTPRRPRATPVRTYIIYSTALAFDRIRSVIDDCAVQQRAHLIAPT